MLRLMASESINVAEICCNEEVGGVMGAIFAVIGCMFLPARSLCRSLHPVTKALIKVGMSTIVGTLDTGFDWAGNFFFTSIIWNQQRNIAKHFQTKQYYYIIGNWISCGKLFLEF